MFHLFDSPPHGIQFGEESDFFPEGCPCELNERDIIRKLNLLQVKYVVFPLTEHISKGIEIFREPGLKLEIQKIDGRTN